MSWRHTEPLGAVVLALGPGVWGRASFFALGPCAAVLKAGLRVAVTFRNELPPEWGSFVFGYGFRCFYRDNTDYLFPAKETRLESGQQATESAGPGTEGKCCHSVLGAMSVNVQGQVKYLTKTDSEPNPNLCITGVTFKVCVTPGATPDAIKKGLLDELIELRIEEQL